MKKKSLISWVNISTREENMTIKYRLLSIEDTYKKPLDEQAVIKYGGKYFYFICSKKEARELYTEFLIEVKKEKVVGKYPSFKVVEWLH